LAARKHGFEGDMAIFLMEVIDDLVATSSTWEPHLTRVDLLAAIEIKLWLQRVNPERTDELISWDVRKLVEQPHRVQNPYYLNFVNLDFSRVEMKEYYARLKARLLTKKAPQPGLKVLYVASDKSISPDPTKCWL
jgi:hypothetical protein